MQTYFVLTKKMPFPISNNTNSFGARFQLPDLPYQGFQDDNSEGEEEVYGSKSKSLNFDTFVRHKKIRPKFLDKDSDDKGKKKSWKTANYFLDIAEAILRAIKSVIRAVGFFINPSLMIAKYTQGSRLAKIAETYAEAAVADVTVRGTPDLLHRALEINGRAAAAVGEFDTMVQAWKDVLVSNKQANKDTHDHFKRA